jgi:uncharacterized protein YkvS
MTYVVGPGGKPKKPANTKTKAQQGSFLDGFLGGVQGVVNKLNENTSKKEEIIRKTLGK